MEEWRRCTIDEVVLGWLRGERDRFVAELPGWGATFDELTRGAPGEIDLDDPAGNHRRMRLLHKRRDGMLVEIPRDTEWYEVRDLVDEDLPRLLVVGRCGWDDPTQNAGNSLAEVVPRRRAAGQPVALRGGPTTWPGSLILWAHSRAGPFTILEGNHRLVAYSAAGLTGLRLPVYVGLSRSYCAFHLPDPITGPLVSR